MNLGRISILGMGKPLKNPDFLNPLIKWIDLQFDAADRDITAISWYFFVSRSSVVKRGEGNLDYLMDQFFGQILISFKLIVIELMIYFRRSKLGWRGALFPVCVLGVWCIIEMWTCIECVQWPTILILCSASTYQLRILSPVSCIGIVRWIV